jgi:tetratricopeptide (TPR) repeat protein
MTTLDALGQLKRASVVVRSPAGLGTAYLVSPTELATCHHVVESAGLGADVTLLLDGTKVAATVRRWDEQTDCALLEIASPLAGREPLRLAGACAHKAAWDGYGFPRVVDGEGIPFFGTVIDPESRDDEHRPMITLYSDQLAAGMTAAGHGLAGGPVVVGGAVIGHFSRALAAPEGYGRPALGVVYASRAANVLSLLGQAPAVPVAQSPDVVFLADQIPAVGPDEYHAFISYRSSDRPFAKALFDRLDAIGLRVFLDVNELVAGDQLAARLHNALGRSRCGIVLVSQEWTESPWCREEGNALVARAVNEDGKFRVIPLRLDDMAMPGLFAGRLWLDFAGNQIPAGRKLEEVVYAVLGRPAPARGTLDQKVQATLTSATDEALRRIDRMLEDPQDFRTLVDFLKRSGLPEVAPRLRAAEALIEAGRPEAALELLSAPEPSIRACQLRALALSRAGRHQEALDLLEPLRNHGPIDSETWGILGGIYKRLWRQKGNRAHLIKSFDTYQEAYAATGDSYVGINVATLALMLDDAEESRRVAMAVQADLGARPLDRLGLWHCATLAEAFVITGQLDQAARWYRRAVAKTVTRPANIAVMRTQARMLLEKKQLGSRALDPSLPVPSVVTFSGHLTDAPGRALPRFPEAKATAVGERIARALRDRGGVVHGVCSAARGSDLLFLEDVLENDGTATVFLPFPAAAFKQVSVGYGWDARCDAVLSNPRVDVRPPLLDVLPPEPDRGAAFEACNRTIIQEGRRLARQVDDKDPVLLTVWNGAPGDGAGGTAHAVTTWLQYGFRHENINIAEERS